MSNTSKFWIISSTIAAILVVLLLHRPPRSRFVQPMKIMSAAFKEGDSIPAMYTCEGENINPPLSISDIPQATKSLALIVEDPDAPTGTFVHWVIWNIDPSTTEIPEGSIPVGAMEGMNGAGENTYIGPCPPNGLHHYHFRLYALDTMLSLTPTAGKEEVLLAMDEHMLETAELIGVYQKKK